MTDVALGVRRAALGVRVLAVVLGAVLVALAAQVSIPLPGTPVPMTLQPMAVLLVGGLLGARLGALSMILYLAMGAAGLPVFTPTVPLVGVARLFGPTGGYLLAYPIAAYAVGAIVPPRRIAERGAGGEDWTRVALGVFAGLVVIHLGGIAQLAVLTAARSTAARLARSSIPQTVRRRGTRRADGGRRRRTRGAARRRPRARHGRLEPLAPRRAATGRRPCPRGAG